MSVSSDHRGEFVERCRTAKMWMPRIDAEFVVVAAKVLDERA
jgi:hypothetical protein